MKFLYLTLITCFLFLSCESDDSPYKSSALIADYKVQLLDDDSEKFEFSFSNEDGIFGLIRSSNGFYKEAVQIHKDGTIETLFSPTTLQEYPNISPAKLAGTKHTSSETLETTELYLLLENRIYKFHKNDKSLTLYKDFTERSVKIENFIHAPYTDYFIVNEVSRGTIGYFSTSSNLFTIDYIESTANNASSTWDSRINPVFFENSVYFLGQSDNSRKLTKMTYPKFTKTPSFTFNTIKPNVHDNLSNLQIDSNGELYAQSFSVSLVHLNMEKELPVSLFLGVNQLNKYNIQYKNSSETDLLDIFERQNQGAGFTILSIKNFFILENDLYIVKNKDVIKISNFNDQLLITQPM